MKHITHGDVAHLSWIDCAKGFTILLVVLLYASEWAENAVKSQGWLHNAMAFATPFRMPDFFLLSGLLLSFSIQRDWRTYLDRKVAHFAYFYILWLTILVAFEAPWIAETLGLAGIRDVYLRSFVRPYSMLWLIYLLPLFYVTTKLLYRVPPAAVWLLAAVLQILQPETGIKVLDKFTPYYVYFYSGYILAPRLFALVRWSSAQPALAGLLLMFWAVINAWAVHSGVAGMPGIALGLGFLGAWAIIMAAGLLDGARAAVPLVYCGRNTIVIYLGFYIPLKVAGELAESTGWLRDSSALALLAAAAGVAAPLMLHRVVRGTCFAFLFERPGMFWLAKRRGRAEVRALAT